MHAYKSKVVIIAGMSSELLSWEPKLASAATFVMIPGNPGSPFFYADYLQALYEECGQNIRIFCIGHAGHSLGAANTKLKYSLKDQVAHKTAFLQEVLESYTNQRLIVAGHSIGALCALEALRSLSAAKLAQVILLFPTLMHLRATPNGAKLSPLFKYGRSAAIIGFDLLNVLPTALKMKLFAHIAARAGVRLGATSALPMQSLLHKAVIDNILYMAHDEMETVGDLAKSSNHTKHESKFIFYYGQSDGWVNEAHIASVKAMFPSSQVLRCQKGHRHDFVVDLESSRILARDTRMWIEA